MSKSKNLVILIGNLGAAPDTGITNNKQNYANFSLATSTEWKDKETGELKENTEWHTVVFYGGLAKVAEQFLKTGTKVYIEGHLRTRKWHDEKNNIDRYTSEIIGDDLIMLSSPVAEKKD